MRRKYWAGLASGSFLELIERTTCLGLRLLDAELGEVDLVDDFATEKAVELGD
jgi:hypothetical protein